MKPPFASLHPYPSLLHLFPSNLYHTPSLQCQAVTPPHIRIIEEYIEWALVPFQNATIYHLLIVISFVDILILGSKFISFNNIISNFILENNLRFIKYAKIQYGIYTLSITSYIGSLKPNQIKLNFQLSNLSFSKCKYMS